MHDLNRVTSVGVRINDGMIGLTVHRFPNTNKEAFFTTWTDDLDALKAFADEIKSVVKGGRALMSKGELAKIEFDARASYEERRKQVLDPVADPLADALWNLERAARRALEAMK